MPCNEFRISLDDYSDGLLAPEQRGNLERHAAHCVSCRQLLAREQQIRELITDYGNSSAPAIGDDYFDRVLELAAKDSSVQQRNRWLMTGLAGAVAAGIAVLIVSGVLMRTPAPGDPGAGIPLVSMAVAEPRVVNLVFSASAAVADATLTVLLPPGMEIAGFAGAQSVSWRTSLNSGRNPR
jgi:anti-sigma factor RsiW